MPELPDIDINTLRCYQCGQLVEAGKVTLALLPNGQVPPAREWGPCVVQCDDGVVLVLCERHKPRKRRPS